VAERLAVENVSKVYPGGNHALRGPTFTVEPGTFMVLLGPSGSGKTTLLRTIAGIERLTSGRLVIGETVVADGRIHLPPERRDLAMVFQDYALWPHLSAQDNVAFALKRHRIGRSAARRHALSMLERVGLAHLAERFPVQLSGGEQQRVALARALVGDTGLLLCDEPLSNLDADLRERMRVEISSLVREAGATTIYITHDQLEAFALADQVGVLQDGVLVQLGAPEDIYSAPATLFVARFTGLAGELEVTVVTPGRGPGYVSVQPVGIDGARPFDARVGGDPEAPTVPSPGTLLAIRPTAVRLCAAESETAHLVGSVADTAFRGRHYELVVDLPGGRRLTGVLSERRVPRGTPVGVELDAAGCILFNESEPGASGASRGDAKSGRPGDAGSTGAPEANGAASATRGTGSTQ
jgi:iron(III) transport system ATP-binding protein